MKLNFNKQSQYFIQQLEAFQLNLNEEKCFLENSINDQFDGLSSDQIYNIINSDQILLQWVNFGKQEKLIQMKQELNNIVELLLNESLQIQEKKNNQQENSIEDYMQSQIRDKEIQIKSCINHQILVIKEIGDYITNKRQELNSWENLIDQIASSYFTLEQEVWAVKDQNSLIKQILEDHSKQTQCFDKIIIGQEKIDIKQQKQFKQEQQIELLNKQHDPSEYFFNFTKVPDNKQIIINQQNGTKLDFKEDKIELLQANKICMKDLYDEFQVSSIIEKNKDELQINENSEFHLIQQGLLQLKSGFYEQSSSIFEKAIKLNTNNSRAYHCKANSLALLNQNNQADDLYSISIKLDPNYESCYVNKGIFWSIFQVRNLYMNWKFFEEAADKLLIEIKIKFPNCKKIQYIEQYQNIRKSMKKREENKDRQY
ncbi:hypothetical protein pb186bvf_010896 [Paramecium bursaria]